MGEQRYSSKNS